MIWISGFSAAGKTTVGRDVERLLRVAGYQTVFLDGDQLRSILAHKWGYSADERQELARIYFRLGSHLSKQGLIVIVAAVAMFDEVRLWFRQNIHNGFEAYLRVPPEVRVQRDAHTKGLYRKNLLDNNQYTEPHDPDIIIDNYGEIDSAAAAESIVVEFLNRAGTKLADYGRSEYWSDYYRNSDTTCTPSPFAEFFLDQIQSVDNPGGMSRLLEIGCGNGRDARFFAENGLEVVALDKSCTAIEQCKREIQHRSLSFFCGETHQVSKIISGRYHYVYSRFSLHAMPDIEEARALESAFGLLEPNGHIYIECRSINDPLARRGEVLSPTERIDGHYRRFIDLTSLQERLKRIGFHVVSSQESRGLAPYGDEDPVVIRVVARKP
ncbi:MAG: adenylyl-sulfate kinase [Longimicrobiales bacterium]|nr:adenylyl-sulfate kinase [Longimicrobiales bacterium]